ncbi:hypothetical protein Sa4125_30830 [Aureimonas sp. SA4125]|nr:hypothetical protein Sa4125_30830 [Aureimonas sp. SA4125]
MRTLGGDRTLRRACAAKPIDTAGQVDRACGTSRCRTHGTKRRFPSHFEGRDRCLSPPLLDFRLMTRFDDMNELAPFLRDGGEMGARMRDHDWSNSPLGFPGDWPQCLRSVVGVMLGSKFPMFLAWGPDLGLLYNDAYAEILGTKHPEALGRLFQDVWGEIWSDILPFIETALSGHATWLENLPLRMNRRGYVEDTFFTFSYSPASDDEGHIVGMFCVCTETTAQVLAERRREALLQLDARLRASSGTSDLSFAASELLGETLGASRVGYGVFDSEVVSALVVEIPTLKGVAEAVTG